MSSSPPPEGPQTGNTGLPQKELHGVQIVSMGEEPSFLSSNTLRAAPRADVGRLRALTSVRECPGKPNARPAVGMPAPQPAGPSLLPGRPALTWGSRHPLGAREDRRRQSEAEVGVASGGGGRASSEPLLSSVSAGMWGSWVPPTTRHGCHKVSGGV